MDYTKLGKTDLNVSRLCLGTMGFGAANIGQHTWTLNEEKSKEIIKRALDLGINFIDTAIGYSNGTSEQYVGMAIKDYIKREDVVLATKFFPRMSDEIASGVSDKEHINKLLDMSLQNLGTDYIDLYIYHFWDYNIPIEEVMETLNEVVKAGKVRYIGISNCFERKILMQRENMMPQLSRMP